MAAPANPCTPGTARGKAATRFHHRWLPDEVRMESVSSPGAADGTAKGL
jgi:hypothetical protein